MFFEFSLLVPANTAKALPASLDVDLCAGIVTKVDVQFPSGCNGLAHVIIRRALHRLWPSNTDEDISGDDTIVSFPEEYYFDEPPYGVTLEGWNEDTAYPHTIGVRLTIKALEPVGSVPEVTEGLTLEDILS